MRNPEFRQKERPPRPAALSVFAAVCPVLGQDTGRCCLLRSSHGKMFLPNRVVGPDPDPET